MAQSVNFSLRRLPGGDGWRGEIELPQFSPRTGMELHPIAVAAKANDRGTAARRVGDLASRLADNPAVASMLPPGAAPLLKELGAVARSKAAGQVITIGSKAIRKLSKWF